MPPALVLSPDVADARARGAAIVALETTIVTHGLPYPTNVDTARRVEAAVREEGAVPATIGIVDGCMRVGLDSASLERLARGPSEKVQARGLPLALARGISGGTTVSATMHIAAAAGVRVFATGGIGGVHRQVERTGDISEDLAALARYPVAVVSCGAKAILDLPRTLEALESLGVPVVGFRTNEFPAFYHGRSGLPIPRAETAEEIAAIAAAAWNDAEFARALLVCNPPPEQTALDTDRVEHWIAEAVTEATERGVSGAALTPHLLAALDRASGGATVRTNVALVESNVRLGARIALALATGGRHRS